jgi:GNAT superfamily N-acetyltransferase
MSPERFEPTAMASPPAQRLLSAFYDEIVPLYPGWEPGAGPTAEPEEFVPPGGLFLVAWLDAEAVACGGFKRIAPDIAEIKRLYVAPEARGTGTARRLLHRLEAAAAAAGYVRVRLDTGARQPAALALFLRTGYAEIADYNGNPYASYWLEKELERS